MKRSSVLLVASLLASVAGAQTSTYGFLRNDASARSAALNGSFVSMTGDPVGIFYNPALIATILHRSASASFLKHILDVNGGSLAYSQEWEEVGQLGIGIQFLDYGTFTRTDASMNRLGEFGSRDLAVVAGVGRSVEGIGSVGINVKFISSSIAEFSSSALAVDFGYLYQLPEEGITLGASLLNIGSQLRAYAGVRENLPADLKIGLTKRPEHLPVFLNLNFHHMNEDQPQFLDRLSSFSFGAEFLMSEAVRIRAGYNNELRKELKLGTSAGLAGFSFGGGLLVKEYQIDYAFNSFGRVGSLHRFSIGMNF